MTKTSLVRGMSGPAVKELQQMLKDVFDPKTQVTSFFGQLTEQTLVAFQTFKGLKADGVAGPITMGVLVEMANAQNATMRASKMDGITEDVLMKGLGMGATMAAKVTPHLNQAMREFGIDTPVRIAMFIANCAHESGNFTILVENLNYSAEGLAKTWPKRFATGGKPNQLAVSLAKKPQAIANCVYANRMGNGEPTSGDGWKFRGRGPIQVTGCDNHRVIGEAIGVDLVNNPEKLEELLTGLRAAAYHVTEEGAQRFADKGDFDGFCDEVNFGRKTDKVGDAIGYADRRAKYVKVCKALGINP